MFLRCKDPFNVFTETNFALWYHFLQCYAVTIFLRRYLDFANFECLCTEYLKSRNWISILMELIFSSSSWLITECQSEPSGWNPVGAVVLGASHYLYVDSQGCRRWVPVSKTELYVIVSDRKWWSNWTQVYVHLYRWKSICRPESQHCVFCWRILAVHAMLPALKLPFVGSKNISDANLESYSYRTWQWSCRHWIWHYFWSCIGHAISPVTFLWSGKTMKSRSKC